LLQSLGWEVFGSDPREEAIGRFPGEPLGAAGDQPLNLIVICVPTPGEQGGLSVAALERALAFASTLAAASNVSPVLAIRSTLMPGTMETVVAPALTAVRERLAAVCYWPCFARERQAGADEIDPWAVVIGTDADAPVRQLFGDWFAQLTCPVSMVDWRTAELAKASANAFNALKISFFNAVGDWSAAAGVDGQQVADLVALAAEAVWNPSYGTRVGPPFGGACLPKDLDALIGWLRQSGHPHDELLAAVRAVNASPLRQSLKPLA
jgi:GDP-mannose 6-dehydrogenase